MVQYSVRVETDAKRPGRQKPPGQLYALPQFAGRTGIEITRCAAQAYQSRSILGAVRGECSCKLQFGYFYRCWRHPNYRYRWPRGVANRGRKYYDGTHQFSRRPGGSRRSPGCKIRISRRTYQGPGCLRRSGCLHGWGARAGGQHRWQRKTPDWWGAHPRRAHQGNRATGNGWRKHHRWRGWSVRRRANGRRTN